MGVIERSRGFQISKTCHLHFFFISNKISSFMALVVNHVEEVLFLIKLNVNFFFVFILKIIIT